MKRFEDFNIRFGTNETKEEQAFGMVLSNIAENLNIDEVSLECYEQKFKAEVEWLNEEIDDYPSPKPQSSESRTIKEDLGYSSLFIDPSSEE